MLSNYPVKQKETKLHSTVFLLILMLANHFWRPSCYCSSFRIRFKHITKIRTFLAVWLSSLCSLLFIILHISLLNLITHNLLLICCSYTFVASYLFSPYYIVFLRILLVLQTYINGRPQSVQCNIFFNLNDG